jgi:hypothetical protein
MSLVPCFTKHATRLHLKARSRKKKLRKKKRTAKQLILKMKENTVNHRAFLSPSAQPHEYLKIENTYYPTTAINPRTFLTPPPTMVFRAKCAPLESFTVTARLRVMEQS